MKYNENYAPLVCMMTQSTCYKGTRPMSPVGVLWHSTGCNNPNLSRYVQPDDTAPNRYGLIQILGLNQAGTDWNHLTLDAGVNAWIGKKADGRVGTVQTLPWNYRPWGCGRGKIGSCNSGWVQFEICEDGLNDKEYFDEVLNEAVELTAYLCAKYKLDPWGKVGKVPVITCHVEAAGLGFASNHADPLHWFTRYGVTMRDVRERVASLMYNNTPADKASKWASEAWSAACSCGAMDGTNPQGTVTREMLAVVLHRLGVI